MRQQRPLAQLPQYRTGVHRGQLVLVAQQDQLGVGGQGIKHRRHKIHVHHRGLVDHQDIHQQRVVPVMAEFAGIRPAAQ